METLGQDEAVADYLSNPYCSGICRGCRLLCMGSINHGYAFPLQRPEQHQQPRLQSRKASDRQGMHHCFGNREQRDR